LDQHANCNFDMSTSLVTRNMKHLLYLIYMLKIYICVLIPNLSNNILRVDHHVSNVLFVLEHVTILFLEDLRMK